MSEDRPKGKTRPKKGQEKAIEELFNDEGTREFLKGLKRIAKRNKRFVEGISELFADRKPSSKGGE